MNELAKEIHQNAISKGFYEKEKNIGEMLALIHSEVSEALEADRKDRYDNNNIDTVIQRSIDEDYEDRHFAADFNANVKGTFEEEMADIIIRVLDLCAYKKINIEKYINAKMRVNAARQKYHGKKY